MKLKAFFALFVLVAPEIQSTNAPKRECPEVQSLLVARPLPSPVSKAFYRKATEELDASGTVVGAGQKLPPLPDESYLFIVVNLTGKPGDEIVVYSLRAPKPEPAVTEPRDKGQNPGFVATHPSLVRQLARELELTEENVKAAVYASGEFQTISGNLHQVSNASPFFRSGKEQLDYSVSILDSKLARTLPGSPKGVLTEKKGATFAREKAHAEAAIQNRSDLERASLREDLVMLISQLVRKIPSQEIRGGIDEVRLKNLRSQYLESFPKADRSAHDFEPLIPLVLGSRDKGLDLAIEEFCRPSSGACVGEFERYFQNFISAIGLYGLRIHKPGD